MKQTTAMAILMIIAIAISAASVAAVQTQYQTNSPVINIFMLNQNPDKAKAGDVVDVMVRVQNLGGSEAQGIVVRAHPSYPFTVLEGENDTQTIASLPNWPDDQKSRTLTYKLRTNRDATEGQYAAEFQYSLDGGKNWASKEFQVAVTTKEFAEIIYIDKTKLMPGKETNLTFTINNIGSAPLQNVVFYWSEPNGYVLPVSTDNTRYIRFLDEGMSIPLPYTVIASVNAKPDLYNIDLTLEYDIKNLTGGTNKESIKTKAGVFVGGETDFDVTFSESSAGQTSLSVANVGSTPAMSVTVRVPQQEGYRVQGSTDAVVGNLDKGDYTIVSFQITQTTGTGASGGFGRRNQTGTGGQQGAAGQQGAQAQYPQGLPEGMSSNFTPRSRDLKVQIDYTDTTGVRQRVEKPVSIQFRNAGNETMINGRSRTGAAASTSILPTWLHTNTIIGLAIVVLGFLIWKYYFNKQNK